MVRQVWLLLGLTLCSTSVGASGVTMRSYNNNIFQGPAIETVLPSISFKKTFVGPVSIELEGTLSLDDLNSTISFQCNFEADIAFLWVDDHLVCQKSGYTNSEPRVDGTEDNPFKRLSKTDVPVRLTLTSANGGSVSASASWKVGTKTPYVPLPTERLSPTLDPLEVTRMELQSNMTSGWGLWLHNSIFSFVLLPDSISIDMSICNVTSGDCKNVTRIEDSDCVVRVGLFANDRSYAQYFIAWKGVNVSVEFSARGQRDVDVVVTPQDPSVVGDNMVLYFAPRSLWSRAAHTTVNHNTITAQAAGQSTTATKLVVLSQGGDEPEPPRGPAPLDSTKVQWSTSGGNVVSATRSMATSRVGFKVNAGRVTLSTSDDPQAAIVARVLAAERAETARYVKYGDLAEVKSAVQAAVMWNLIYVPAEAGPVLPVSRSWAFSQGGDADWGYVIFDWDNIFASYMASLDNKEVAYSNLIQVIRSKTSAGFVPNYAAGGSKSSDRTEPPVGSKVLREMYNKYEDKWLVELLFDDLLDWSNWFMEHRVLGSTGLICLGSSDVTGLHTVDSSADAMQGARYESGLDNSPMYDGEFFNNKTAQMQLVDVGFSAMVAADALHLAELGRVIGRPEATMLEERGHKLSTLVTTQLWHDDLATFSNRFPNGTFYPRISPTSFYPLMTANATDTQARTIVEEWLLQPKNKFCVNVNFPEGSNPDCYWGLPSINSLDPAYPPLGYWRGYVWGPMAQLTYWSLQEYSHLPEVNVGRKALCKQMTAMMLNQWRRNRHICENFNPHQNATDCSGTLFYHWGGLAGMISLVEGGFY